MRFVQAWSNRLLTLLPKPLRRSHHRPLLQDSAYEELEVLLAETSERGQAWLQQLLAKAVDVVEDRLLNF